jgi:DNA-directed RNA polymerase subunit RPC12/RpoP
MKRNAIPPQGFAGEPGGTDAYKEFDATELYCSRCKQSVPVRKRLLLVLPEGDKYEYLCAYCSETVGTKMDKQESPLTLIS